jgi:hypothetical protein
MGMSTGAVEEPLSDQVTGDATIGFIDTSNGSDNALPCMQVADANGFVV